MTDPELLEARMLIAGFFKKRRIELNITVGWLAEMTGFKSITIENFEAGKFWPHFKQFLLLCEALELSPSLLPFDSSKEFIEVVRKSFKK